MDISGRSLTHLIYLWIRDSRRYDGQIELDEEYFVEELKLALSSGTVSFSNSPVLDLATNIVREIQGDW